MNQRTENASDGAKRVAPRSECRLCGSQAGRLLFVKRGTPHFACADCGLVFSRPEGNPNMRPLEEFDDAYLQYFADAPADEANHSALAKWLGEFAPLSGARILDVGCGSGKWARYLRGRGADAAGLEPSSGLFGRFLSDEDFFFHGEMSDLRKAGRGPFDIITAFDVIEHTENPGAFLDDMSALLVDGGVAAISTPDCGSPHARLAGRRWHFYHEYHLSLFNRETLTGAARARGLEPLHFSRRGRLRSCGYVVRYGFLNLLGRPAPRWAARLDPAYIPTNLWDVMHLCFRKKAGNAPACASCAP